MTVFPVQSITMKQSIPAVPDNDVLKYETVLELCVTAFKTTEL